MPTEVTLGFDVTFIHAAPGCTQEKISDVPGIRALPLRDFGGCCVLFRAANERRAERSKLLEDLLL